MGPPIKAARGLRAFVALIGLITGCGAPPGAAVPHPFIDDVVLQAAVQRQAAALAAFPIPKDGLPLVLVHGMAGFRPIASLLDYFYKVRLTMQARGFHVYTLQTDAFQSVAHRAQQLAIEVDEVLRLTGAPKVHVIAHSQGGLDMRYLIATLGYGDRIDTLVTLGTPHHGVALVDVALKLVPAWVEPVTDVVNTLANALLGGNNDIMAQLHDLTHCFVDGTFNLTNPDDPRVAYYSYAGMTQPDPFVDLAVVDVVNPFLAGTHHLLQSLEGDNDGLVSLHSAQWGTYLGTLAADHWDQIGQPPTMRHPSFNHLDFYNALGNFFKTGGDPPLF